MFNSNWNMGYDYMNNHNSNCQKVFLVCKEFEPKCKCEEQKENKWDKCDKFMNCKGNENNYGCGMRY